MRKLSALISIMLFMAPSCFGMNFGMYKPEDDYGLIDGFKINFGKERAERNKLIEVKSEMPGEKERMAKEKARYEADEDKKADDEYQMFKFMLDDTIPF